MGSSSTRRGGVAERDLGGGVSEWALGGGVGERALGRGMGERALGGGMGERSPGAGITIRRLTMQGGGVSSSELGGVTKFTTSG